MLSISLPEQYSSMFNLSADRGLGAPKEGSTTPTGQLTNDVEREIVSLLDKLACSIYQKEAKESILSLSRKLEGPRSKSMFIHVNRMLSKYSFNANMRRYIHALFNKGVAF